MDHDPPPGTVTVTVCAAGSAAPLVYANVMLAGVAVIDSTGGGGTGDDTISTTGTTTSVKPLARTVRDASCVPAAKAVMPADGVSVVVEPDGQLPNAHAAVAV